MIADLWNIFKESTLHFEEQEKDEMVIMLLRRHPFVVMMPMGFVGSLALAPIFVFVVFYSYIMASYLSLFLFISSLYYMVLWLIAFYLLTMYVLNTVIITNKRIIDRDQHGFFDQKVSELHLYRVQDVTVYTKGIIPTTLRYGDVIVQTAGIEQKFIFHEVPHPELVKASIMKAVSMANSGVKPVNNADALKV
jgi:uncharacterized membrane protein YdbT with pleckstrin-like domain